MIEANINTGYLYSELYHPPFLPVVVLAFPILPFFWKYHVSVSENKQNLSIGYSTSWTEKNIAISTIESAEPIEHINGLTGWGGWGIRLNLRGETGYISKNGPGVKVVYKETNEKKYTYVFNCEDPNQVCALLNSSNKIEPSK